MVKTASICGIEAREILDSRGNPTVEADVYCEYAGTLHMGRASVPSGASTGQFEAVEKRDGDKSRYGGKGVLQAVNAIKTELNGALVGMDAMDQAAVDAALCAADGTPTLERLGANAVLAVSIACAKAAAAISGLPLYRWLGGSTATLLPMPMMNVINGGAHAGNNLDIQEFMLIPVSAVSFADALRMCAEVYRVLGGLLRHAGVGDEGGYAPELPNDEDALAMLSDAVKKAGYEPGRDFEYALDAASSEWYSNGEYHLPKRKITMTAADLVRYWEGVAGKYPLRSLEDGMAEEDWAGWQLLTEKLGGKLQLVGDDLFVTNTARLSRGIESGAANAVLIKPNQNGTLSGTLDCMREARESCYRSIVSHRSGETEDTTISDIAVASGAGQIKSGAPCRTDRVAKYNQLLRIEEQLDKSARFINPFKK